ncbi:MAG: 30S ribosomal protein S9 [Candidatus Pacearchaeota archaeon]|nr:30S ribosomal protein S9 [Candidatus Pacearchaeota archaeon]
MERKKVIISGKRKTSVARIELSDGKGNISYNGNSYQSIREFHKLTLIEPIRIYEQVLGKFNFDVKISVVGGGKESQVQAARLGIAKALMKFTENKELKDAFINYDRHLLVADVRRKETCKPGDSKARAMRQSSKR